MAKTVKVKMTRVQNQGRIQNSYPMEYDPTKIQIIAYEGINDASKPYCIGVVKDEDLDSFVTSLDIVEITQQEAETLGNTWRPQVTRIIDEQKIIGILEKVSNSQELTQAEKDAINPENSELGINKSTAFTDLQNATIGRVDNG